MMYYRGVLVNEIGFHSPLHHAQPTSPEYGYSEDDRTRQSYQIFRNMFFPIKEKWTHRDSNPRPPACKAGALIRTELWAQYDTFVNIKEVIQP